MQRAALPDVLLAELIGYAREDKLWEDAPPGGALSTTIARVNDVLRRIDAELVRDQQSQQADAETTMPAKLQALSAWLEVSCQADVSGYAFAANSAGDNKGNGVVAQRDIAQADKTFMKIPRKALLSAKFGLAEVPALRPLLAQLADNTVLELAVVVAYHKVNAQTSFFTPYLAVLPEEYAIPLYWDADIYTLLHGTPTAERAAKSLRAAVALYYRTLTTVHKLAPPGLPARSFTWRLFRWALAAVLTRQNNVPAPGPVPGSYVEVQALVPGWDMMNHETGEMLTAFDLESDCLVYEAMRPFPQGGEVSMCYGQRQNELFVLYSGFCLAYSPFDWFELPMRLQADAILRVREGLVRAAAQAEALSQAGTDGQAAAGISLQGAGLVMVPVGRTQPALLHPLAWLVAAASAVDKDEAAALLRSRLTSYADILAADMLSAATLGRVHEALRRALGDYLRPLEGALAAVCAAREGAAAGGVQVQSVRAAMLEACHNLLTGHIHIVREALDVIPAL